MSDKQESCDTDLTKLREEVIFFKELVLIMFPGIILFISCLCSFLFIVSPLPYWLSIVISISLFAFLFVLYVIARLITYIPFFKVSKSFRRILNVIFLGTTLPVVSWGVSNLWKNKWLIGDNLLASGIVIIVLIFLYFTSLILQPTEDKELIIATINKLLSDNNQEIQNSTNHEITKSADYSNHVLELDELLEKISEELEYKVKSKEISLIPKESHIDLFILVMKSNDSELKVEILCKLGSFNEAYCSDNITIAVLEFNQILKILDKEITGYQEKESKMKLYIQKKELGYFAQKINTIYLLIITILAFIQIFNFAGII